MTLSDQILSNYHGCGAYLIAYDATDTVLAIRACPERPRLNLPKFVRKIGRLSKIEAAARARATAQAWRDHEAALAAWALTLTGWCDDATSYDAFDMSCTEIVWRMSSLSWLAHYAIAGEGPLLRGIADIEYRDRAYADEARLKA
jgi:hypothetical protein